MVSVVVRLVARDAVILVRGAELESVARLDVAARTRERGMRSNEVEAGTDGSVAEVGPIPCLLGVTVEACGWEAILSVLAVVVSLVTREAVVLIGRSEDEVAAGRNVTTGAAHSVVCSDQEVAVRYADVIEDGAAGPSQRFMTLLTVGGESRRDVVD
jgi:hypothetical protein